VYIGLDHFAYFLESGGFLVLQSCALASIRRDTGQGETKLQRCWDQFTVAEFGDKDRQSN